MSQCLVARVGFNVNVQYNGRNLTGVRAKRTAMSQCLVARVGFNVSVQYNGGLIPDIILLAQC